MTTNILVNKHTNYSLKNQTTLKIGGEAELAFFPESTEELIQIRDFLISQNKEINVIGAGSNLLVSSQGVSGGVIFTTNIKGYKIPEENVIKVDSGMKSRTLAKLLLENSLQGLEFLIGIPGTIGGAVTMNSSAHGQAIEDVIESAEVLNLETNEILTFDKAQLQLGYRNSFVKHNKHFILNATFKLSKADKQVISEKMDFHINYRKQNHPPFNEANAGSTFRNPERGVYVGKMLQDLDAKSWKEGGAGISDIHANFLINTGDATSLDVSRLMFRMYNGIKERFGYDLIAEIRYIGKQTEEEERIWKSFQVH